MSTEDAGGSSADEYNVRKSPAIAGTQPTPTHTSSGSTTTTTNIACCLPTYIIRRRSGQTVLSETPRRPVRGGRGP